MLLQTLGYYFCLTLWIFLSHTLGQLGAPPTYTLLWYFGMRSASTLAVLSHLMVWGGTLQHGGAGT